MCASCPAMCASCTSAHSCTSYKIIKYWPLSISLNSSSYSIVAVCDTGCSKCSSIIPSMCYFCQPGYTLSVTNINNNFNVSVCILCAYPCKSCFVNNTQYCTTCFANMYLANGICIQCNVSNCALCANSNSNLCIFC
jgi:hypothetical protein